MLQGEFDTQAIAFAEEHASSWRTMIVRPAGVLAESGLHSTLLGAAMERTGQFVSMSWRNT